MVEVIGVLGSALLACCAIPQAYQSYKTKSSEGISWLFLLMWGVGEIFTLVYLLTKDNVLPLIMNYVLNLVFISIIIYYKWRPNEVK